MRNFRKLLIVPAVLAVAACGRDDAPRVDDGLKNDLALASQVQPTQQYMSPQEMGYQQGYGAPYGAPQQYQPAPAYVAPAAARPATVRRVSTTTRARRSTSSGTARSTSSGTVYRAPQPVATRTEVKTNTRRDAAIGAVAGAAVGAAVSKNNRVKGAVIGAAAGGVLGGIIGAKVDVQRREVPVYP